jgi:BMFP domain-containing protein YqiC
MSKNKNFLDDLNKLASSTFSTMVNIKNEISESVKEQIKSSLKGMDFVSKNDFEALKKTVAHLQDEVKKLKGPAKTSHEKVPASSKAKAPKKKA